jgi:hypothetical protein
MLKVLRGAWGRIRLADAAIALMFAPMFTTFAIKRRVTIGKTTFFEYFFLMIVASPLHFKGPILAHIS